MFKKQILIIAFLLTIMVMLCSGQNSSKNFPALKGPYLGQKAPVAKAEVFLDGIISIFNEPEMCGAFTKDGKEFYFNARFKNNWTIFVTKEVGGRWSEPKPLYFTSNYIERSATATDKARHTIPVEIKKSPQENKFLTHRYTDRDFTMSPDGNRIYFGSNRPRKQGGNALESLDIFVTERLKSNKWSAPKNVGTPINTDYGENYPSIAGNGNLYFFSCRGDGLGGCDIYVSHYVNKKYMTPVNLGSAINSKKNDWDAFIAPDESYIIFSSQDREDSIGGQDLYISYKQKDGKWTQAKNMGESVNSESCEICPSVSIDGKYFFFTSRRRGKADIFWIKATIIENLKPGTLK